jgi:hypothetical protein
MTRIAANNIESDDIPTNIINNNLDIYDDDVVLTYTLLADVCVFVIVLVLFIGME